MNSKMYFKLGVVECAGFKVPLKVFLNRMKKLIDDDVNKYGVYYNKKEKSYEIKYNSNQYIAVFSEVGENVTKSLRELATKTTNCLKEIEEEKKVNDNMENKGQFISRAKRAIVDKNVDNSYNIEQLKKEFKENDKGLLKEYLHNLKTMVYGDFHWIASVVARIIIAGGFLIMFLFFVTNHNPLWVWMLLGAGICSGDALAIGLSSDNQNYAFANSYRGLIMALLTISTLPLSLAFTYISRIVRKIKYNKKIEKYKSEIIDTNDKKDTKSLVDAEKIKEVIKTIEGRSNNIDYNKNSVAANIEIEDLRLKIQEIGNKNKRVMTRKELIGIVAHYYYDAINSKNNSEREKLSESIRSQVSRIDSDVDAELAREEQEGTMDKQLYKLMSEINERRDNIVEVEEAPQKSIGTRHVNL